MSMVGRIRYNAHKVTKQWKVCNAKMFIKPLYCIKPEMYNKKCTLIFFLIYILLIGETYVTPSKQYIAH